MKFVIQRDEMNTALQKVVNVIPQRSTIPMTQNVKIVARGNQLELITTDLEITMVSHVKADIQEEGELAIPGRLINDIIKELPNVELTFESGNNYRLQLSSDFGQYKIGGENPAEFPQRPTIDAVKEIVMPSPVMRQLINKTIFACSSDELRPALTGVFFQIGESRIKTVATDGHRLAMMDYFDDSLPDESLTSIISTRALNFVLRSLDSDSIAVMMLGDKHAKFHMENTELYARLIDENYVDYNRVIPQESNFELTVNASDFLSSVRRVSLFSNPITAQVVLELSSQQMTIRAEDIDYGGEAREQIACNFTGDSFEIGFNSRYLQTMLKHVDSAEVVLHLVRPDYAVVARPVDGPENEKQLMLLMPIRLEDA